MAVLEGVAEFVVVESQFSSWHCRHNDPFGGRYKLVTFTRNLASPLNDIVTVVLVISVLVGKAGPVGKTVYMSLVLVSVE